MPGESYNTENQTQPTETPWDALSQEVPFENESHEPSMQNAESERAQESLNGLEALQQPNPERDEKLTTLAVNYLETAQPGERAEMLSCLWQADQFAKIEDKSIYHELQRFSKQSSEYLEAKKLFEDCAVAETITSADNPYVGVAEGFMLQLQIESSNPNLPEFESEQNQIFAQLAQEYIDQHNQQSQESASDSKINGLWPYLVTKRRQLEQEIINTPIDDTPVPGLKETCIKWRALFHPNLNQKFMQLQKSCHGKIPNEEEFMEKYL